MNRVGNLLVAADAVESKSCLKCKELKPIAAFKLHGNKHWVDAQGFSHFYSYRDNTCRKCRWNAIKDRVNAARRKGGQAGERNSQAVLTEDWVTFIRSQTGRKIPCVTLALWVNCSPAAISLARSFKRWNKKAT